jgi:Uma2 family endonuclease
MGITLPVDLLEPITDEDVDRLSAALDGTGVRFEVDEGRLILMAPVKLWHTQVSHRVRNVLEGQGRLAFLTQGIRLGARSLRIPDVAAFVTRPDPDADRHEPALFSLVVEVISLDSVHEDREVKSGLYAKAGVPEYWIADRHPTDAWDAIIDMLRLGERGYEHAGRVALSELESKLRPE